MVTPVFRRKGFRWLVPAGVTTAVVAAAVTVPLIADADAELPERSAEDLLTALAETAAPPLSGTVVQSADVGLPALPGDDTGPGGPLAGGASTALSLLNGTTTARVWYADESTFRVATQDNLAETDLIRNGDDFWLWNSEENTATHATVPADVQERIESMPSATPLPSDAAEKALEAIEPSTKVDVDGTATVAGRSAYDLVLRPEQDGSTIGSIRLAVDAEYSVPLRVRVYDLDGGDPAIEVGFTSVSFDEPDASVFDFTPPPGATVDEFDPSQQHPDGLTPDRSMIPSVVGDGWTSVLVIRGVDLDELAADAAGSSAETAALVDAVLSQFDPVSGAYGEGVLLKGSLVSALVLEDGRVLVGAVTRDVLEQAAMDPAAAVDAPSMP